MNKGEASTDMIQLDKLSKTAKCLLNRRDHILELWVTELRRENHRAAELSEPILIDTLPSFLDNLAEALSPGYPRKNAIEDTTVAEEHGGERARITNYQLGDLITEYQLLRESVLSILSREVQLTAEEFRVIHNSFNMALRESATAFALVHTEIREQFVATLTHDLRNPLNSISMASELLQMDEKLSGDSRGLAVKIYENSRRMDRMIQDLLDVTYVRAGGRLTLSLADTCIAEIVKDVVSQMTLAHGKKFVIKGEGALGQWDGEALRRAIENLATNAIKYGDPVAPITVHLLSEHGRMYVKVHNEGQPIPTEEQEAIFQSFRRSHINQKGKRGWGIGLPLVRAVAEAHGGSIQIDSAPERGTTFTIDIPVNSSPFLDKAVTPQ